MRRDLTLLPSCDEGEWRSIEALRSRTLPGERIVVTWR